jgi:RNA polymerase sporulation-specific sigma factor
MVKTEDLIRLAKEGDKAAEETVILRVEKMIETLARGLTEAAPYNAEDLAQTGLLAVAGAIKTYDESKGAKFSTYAHMCAKRRMLDEIKKDGRRIKTVNIDDAAGLREKGEIDDAIIDKDIIDGISAVLSGFELEALILRAIEKLSYADIAKKLNSSVKAVDNAVARARKKARENLG